MRHLERPAAGEPVGALVFFHGHWGIPEDFVAFLDKLDPAGRFAGYLPQAPLDASEGRYTWARRGPWVLGPEVAAWLDALSIEASRTVLGGWSQGTAVAYKLGLGVDRPRPAGILALGGRLPPEEQLDLVPPFPRIAIGHGTVDESVPVEAARTARDVLVAAGADVLYYETDVGHEIGQAVIPDLQRFLQSVL
jgi:phospholipase/carboxylesterase